MKRRYFIQQSALGTISFLTTLGPTHGRTDERMSRIGISTVLFRNRFAQTNPSGHSSSTLTLLETPEFFTDRFGVHNVEFWSRHFDSLERSYLRELRRKVAKSNCQLINIQCDEKYQIADPDETKRKESLELVNRWVDAAVELGAGAIRINPGKGEFEAAAASYKTIYQWTRKRGLRLMIENHFGMETDPDVHIRLLNSVGAGKIYALPDFGNYPTDELRFTALMKMMPYTYQVSAKASDFDANGNHIEFDFDRCMQLAESSGFRGIYSIEQWSRKDQVIQDEVIGDWLISHVKQNLR